uniref:Uncharacterized protein n=1 Tax=Caenorhabditis tropicalis TaxID=1561998 RepID=A0A1I7TM40_9PELO
MHRNHQSPYYYNAPNDSFDVFSSPRNDYEEPQQESIDVFRETPKRRSSGENESIARAIRNALDPEYEASMDIFGPSSSASVNYDDDASVLAAVSSAHSSQSSRQSSQEQNSNQNSISQMFRSSTRKKESKQTKLTGYAPIFQKPVSTNARDQEQDFLSPEQIERNRKSQRQRPKQIRMDDYVFKARRVDKGAREFGLHTTHEPKRGSKIKSESVKRLEVGKTEYEKQKKRKQKELIEERKAEVEDLDYSLAFGTPSPVRNIRKTSKLTQFFGKDSTKSSSSSSNENAGSRQFHRNTGQKSFVSFNDPTTYSSESVLEATVCLSPDKSLSETINLDSPIREQTTPKRFLVQPNPLRRRDFCDEKDKNRQPLSQPRKQKYISNNRKPEFDYPSSPITLDAEEDLKMMIEPPPKRQALLEEKEKRRKFGDQVTEREQMIRQLVNEDKFTEERENGGIERKRAELKDGQVIRNKGMRKNLMHGASCKCCRGYYDGLGMEENQKEIILTRSVVIDMFIKHFRILLKDIGI